MQNVILISNQEDYQNFHKLLIENQNKNGRGINLIELDLNEDLLVFLSFETIESFVYRFDSNEEKIKQESIVQSILRYDLTYQYCVFYIFENQIVGGAFVPFDRPIELMIATEQAKQVIQ